MEICTVVGIAIVAYVVVQIVRLVFADADLTLLWRERFGRTKESLKGKVIWITGASSGIGKHLAYEFSGVKCQLVLSARNQEALEKVKTNCLTTGKISNDDILVLPMDVCQLSYHEQATKIVIEKFGHIDILINNAGRSQRALVVDTDIKVDQEMIELNVLAPISLVKCVLPSMVERNAGHIVAVSSIAGKIGLPNSATYCLTKFALNGWHDSLRLEMVKKDIDVTIICPGPVHSNIQKNAFTGVSGQAFEGNDDPLSNKMSTSRCAELCVIAIANKLNEVWISPQPALILAYATHFWPGFFLFFNKHFAPLMQRIREGHS